MSNKVMFMGVSVTVKWVISFMALVLAAALLFPVLLEASPEKQAAIAAAEEAIDDIPDPVEMEDMMTIRIARHLVEVAFDLGAEEGDIDNYASLADAEEAIDALFSDDFFRQSILDLTCPMVDDYNAVAFIRNMEDRWWEGHTVNGMCFLPYGSLSSNYNDLDDPEGRWARYDVSGRGYTLMKGYVGIDDESRRVGYPLVFQILADGNPDPIYEANLYHGEYAEYYLVDIEGVDELVFKWFALDDTEDGRAEEFVFVEPQFFIPVSPELEDAIEDAETAIAALPAELTFEDEEDVKAARSLVDEAYDLGVNKEYISNYDELVAAEEAVNELYYEDHVLESLHLLGDPGGDHRNSGWLVSYDDPEVWGIFEEPGTRGTANHRIFAPLKVFMRGWSDLDSNRRYAEWDISEYDYTYLEGYIGVSDISAQAGHPINFTIYGDGEPLYKTTAEYGRDPQFYRVNVEDVEWLKIEFSADSENLTSGGFVAWPAYVEPHFLAPYSAAQVEAEKAIDAIPDPVTMEDMMELRIARHLVDEALKVVDKEDITNLEDLVAAEEAVQVYIYTNYMRFSYIDLPVPPPEQETAFNFFLTRDPRWWEGGHYVNGMDWLPLGSLSMNYSGVENSYPDGRWLEFDISGRGFTRVKFYAGIPDYSTRTEYPLTMQVYGDDVLLEEKILEHGEYAKYFLVDIEGVDSIRFYYYAHEGVEPGTDWANEIVFVEPRFLIPICSEIQDAVDNAKAAIDEIPEKVSLLHAPTVEAAREAVDEAVEMGVEIKRRRPEHVEGDAYVDRIENLSRLLAAEERITGLYHQYYGRESLHELGDPGPSFRSSSWIVDFEDPYKWRTEPGDRAICNFRTFESLKVFERGLSIVGEAGVLSEWNIREMGYTYLEGYFGASDANSGLARFPLDFKIYGDGKVLFEEHIRYGAEAAFYRINVEDVTWLELKYTAERVSDTGHAAWPCFVEPVFLHAPNIADAIEWAENAISELPVPADLTIEDRAAVEEARVLVNNAEYVGVATADISNLGDLEDAEAKIAELTELPDLIAAAIAAIDALPAPEDITNADRLDAVKARILVVQAMDKGALPGDVTNLTRLEAVEAVLEDIWELVYGDVNGDGLVNVEDVVLVMQQVLGLVPFDEVQREAADVNGDEVINVEDVVLIMHKVLGLIEEFPVED